MLTNKCKLNGVFMAINKVFRSSKLKGIENKMTTAEDYANWASLAQKHDHISGKNKWKSSDNSSLYDSAEMRIRHDNLRGLLDDKNYHSLLYTLNEGIHGNMGGMGSPLLYSQAKYGTKQLVEDYVNTIVESLHFLAKANDSQIPFDEKLDFFRRASHCFGRSALMLSGGGGLIYFHHGLVQTLIDENLLPKVISGASAGSWICAQLGTKTDEELRQGHFYNYKYDLPRGPSPWSVLMGLNEDHTPLSFKEQALDGFCSDMTFQEAYEYTGRYISISIAPAEKYQTSRLMNAITSPNVYIRSAIDASSSIPGVVPPVTLYAKGVDGKPKPYLASRKWFDGSFAEDLPAKRLARLFGVNHYIVGLINPLAIPFVADPKLKRTKGVRRMLSHIAMDVIKDGLITMENLMSNYGGSVISPAILLAHAVLDQQYTGDINIILEKNDFHWRNALFEYIEDQEIESLIMAGRRRTWPKIPMIRNASVVGLALDQILANLDQKELVEAHVLHKRHITPFA